MEIEVVIRGERKYLAGLPGRELIRDEGDLIDLLGLCYEHKTNRILFYPANFNQQFFDLSSGQAGMILGKLSVYQVKAAAVLSLDEVQHSHKFEDLVIELNRGNQFRIFKDLPQAEQWLVSD